MPGETCDGEKGAASSSRKTKDTNYKTFILSNAIFEVEQAYEVQEIIGAGAYGTVCLCENVKTQTQVAVKKISNLFEHRSLAKRTLREIKLLRLFDHENIVSLERVMRPHSSTFNEIYMVSELMETDLACVVRSEQPLTEAHCQFFVYQLLRALKYIHSADVIHRDLKPRNLLVNSNCDLKICDFGLARLIPGDSLDRCPLSNYVATRWYRAPEVILTRKHYGKPVDMWAVGCILGELIQRKPLFPGRDSFHQIKLIINVLGTPDPSSESLKDTNKSRDFVAALASRPPRPFAEIFPGTDPVICDLLTKLLEFDPSKRITVEEALRHPYMDELHCEEDEPVALPLDPDEFYFDKIKMTKAELRTVMLQEIVTNYKKDFFKRTFEAAAVHVIPETPKSAARPKGARARRKSW